MKTDELIRDTLIALLGEETADCLCSRRPDLAEAAAVAVGLGRRG